ncbi:MAG: response regulator [Nitrospirae bacterium]|nr:MAG: response regulator [Nitrospirota bacterium]
MERSKFRILVIDDDEIARDVVVSLLSKEGFTVDSARDGIEGLAAVKKNDYHLVITDLKMPGADGIEVLKSVRNINPSTAVVILTAYGTLDNALEAMRLGAFDYVTKPFKLQQLLIVVENAMSRSILREENEELRRILRETYRDLETIKSIRESGSEIVIMSTLERIGRLSDRGVLDRDEAELLREELMKGKTDAARSGSR